MRINFDSDIEENFYKVSYVDHTVKIIIASNKYEALGYYFYEVLKSTGCIDDVLLEKVDSNMEIEASCIGFPVYKTLKQILQDKLQEEKNYSIPSVVIGLLS